MDLQEKSKTAKVSFPKIPILQKISLHSNFKHYGGFIALDFSESKAYATDGYSVLIEDFVFEGSMVGLVLIPSQIFRKVGKEFTISQDDTIRIPTKKETFEFTTPRFRYPNVPRLVEGLKGKETLKVQLSRNEFKAFSEHAKKMGKNVLNNTSFRFWLAKGCKRVIATADNVDFGVHYNTKFEQSVESSLDAKIILRGPMLVNFAKVTNGIFSYLPSERIITTNGDGLTAVFLTEPDYD